MSWGYFDFWKSSISSIGGITIRRSQLFDDVLPIYWGAFQPQPNEEQIKICLVDIWRIIFLVWWTQCWGGPKCDPYPTDMNGLEPWMWRKVGAPTDFSWCGCPKHPKTNCCLRAPKSTNILWLSFMVLYTFIGYIIYISWCNNSISVQNQPWWSSIASKFHALHRPGACRKSWSPWRFTRTSLGAIFWVSRFSKWRRQKPWFPQINFGFPN